MIPFVDAMKAAFDSQGENAAVNHFHRIFLQTSLFLPIDKNYQPNEDEPFRPLFAEYENRIFLLAFSSLELLTSWAGKDQTEVACIDILGKDLIKGIGDEVYLLIHADSQLTKEFSPDEIKHLKKVIARIDQLKS